MSDILFFYTLPRARDPAQMASSTPIGFNCCVVSLLFHSLDSISNKKQTANVFEICCDGLRNSGRWLTEVREEPQLPLAREKISSYSPTWTPSPSHLDSRSCTQQPSGCGPMGIERSGAQQGRTRDLVFG